jgi:alpha-beta hydrolase superfamily lysophospholipase
LPDHRLTRRTARWILGLAVLLLAGCASLDEKQGAWIFQPSDRTWGGYSADGMADRWIEFDSRLSGKRVRLHALWQDAPARKANDGVTPDSKAPVLLYLHGSRWNVTSSSFRARRMQELGFAVLALDYRGFGKSDAAPTVEASAYEDARAAWDWLGQTYPGRPRYIFGHSLGGAIAIELASQVDDEAGVMVEGTFTSIRDVVGTTKWGWLPIGPLITQRFDAQRKVGSIGSPLLVVHGTDDTLIKPELGRRLFDAAAEPKAFVLVEGGSHHNTNALGQSRYRSAMADLFGLR